MPLPHELTTASSTVKAGIRAALGLLSASLRNTGTAQNEIPLLGVGGKLAVALIPTGTAEGLIPIIGAGGKLPIEIMPDGVGGGGSLFATKIVANQAARLALTNGQARGFVVLDADTGKSWGLVTGGTPATSGDWVQVGDRDIVIADVAGLATALAGKVGTGGEGVDVEAFLTALGIAPPTTDEERRQERLEIGVTESVTVRRVTPTMSPDVSGTLQRVTGQTLHGQPVWTSDGTLTPTAGVEDFTPPPTGTWAILSWAPEEWRLISFSDGLGIATWSAADGSLTEPDNDPWDVVGWNASVMASGVPALEADGDDVTISPGLSDPRLIGDYQAIGTQIDGQEVWTKDGAPFTDANVAAMVFSAGVDEDDDGVYNLSFYTAGVGSGSGFYSTDNASPPPTGSWVAFGDEVGTLQVTSEVLTADRIASALLPYQYLATILAAMTEEQKRLILPNTALVDYVQLQNFAGYTVPPNSLGQKDGVLYFGDSPLQAGSSKQVIDVYALVNNTLAGPNRWNRSLGTFDVAPGEFLANNFFLLEFDLHFLFSSGEAPASNEAALFASLVFDNELVDIEVTLAGALMVDICPFVAGRERVTLRGSWLLQGAGGGLSGGGSSLLKTDLNSATLASTSRLLQFFSEDGMGYGSGPANPSAPDHLNLVVMPVLGAIPASGIVVSGRVSFGPAAVS